MALIIHVWEARPVGAATVGTGLTVHRTTFQPKEKKKEERDGEGEEKRSEKEGEKEGEKKRREKKREGGRVINVMIIG